MAKKALVLVIVGPTASGKSTLAVRLAQEFDGEIISADSRQVYKGLDIGSGKITKAEMAGVPHHLLDIASPRRIFTVAQFQKQGRKKLKEIAARGRLPIICGGSGFYVESLIDNPALPAVKPNLKLRQELNKRPPAELFARLEKLDPVRAQTIDRHNPRRLVRAIEIATALGHVPPIQKLKTLPAQIDESYSFLFLGGNPPLPLLEKKIKARLTARLQRGLIAEVRRLKQAGLSSNRLEALGLEYRYVNRYLENRLTKNNLEKELALEIFKYAKRQLTWLQRWKKKIQWITSYRQARSAVKKSLKQKAPR